MKEDEKVVDKYSVGSQLPTPKKQKEKKVLIFFSIEFHFLQFVCFFSQSLSLSSVFSSSFPINFFTLSLMIDGAFSLLQVKRTIELTTIKVVGQRRTEDDNWNYYSEEDAAEVIINQSLSNKAE